MKLKRIKKQTGGRNNQGVITTYHRGGKCTNKKFYRIIDFKRSLLRVPGRVKKIERDPNRNCMVALVGHQNGLLSYILAPTNLKVGDKINQYGGHTYISPIKELKAESEFIQQTSYIDFKIGNAMPLKKIPIGSYLHNIELKPGKGGQLVRSAGTFAKLLSSERKSKQMGKKSGKGNKANAIIRLNSGRLLSLSNEGMATLGTVSVQQKIASRGEFLISGPLKGGEVGKKPKLRKAGENR